MGWFVRDRSMKRSTQWGSKQQAKRISRNVRNSSVSKNPGGHHRSGCGGLLLIMILAGVLIVAAVNGRW